MSATPKRTVILISGRGSNMAALIAASKADGFPATIVGVISSRADAAGLDIATKLGVATRIVSKTEHPTREAQEAATDAALREFGAEVVCLAGFMRLLSAEFTEKWRGRMINIHPALLPSLKGLDTHRRALDAGLRIHGCTVHFVTPETDDGPIIAQSAVPVLTGDTEAALGARVLKAEHELFAAALELVATGKARMENGRTVFDHVETSERKGLGVLTSPGPAHGPSDLENLARFTP